MKQKISGAKLKNEQTRGEIFYGMHFYPGVCRYEAPDKRPLTVFVNETVIREMGPSFAGCPIFVEHVEDVDPDLDELRGEADGWVIESFFNADDGKHWAKFVIVSERGLRAVHRGWRLSNCYVPRLNNKSGFWNGVPYQQEVVGGEFEHLAIVQSPRYEESVIMTPDEFKNYNNDMAQGLKRFANSKNKGDNEMFEIFKKTKVENSVDLEGMMVRLPTSKKEMSIKTALTEYDKFLNMHGYASGEHMVKVGENEEMSVNDLVKKHLEACNSLEDMKKANAAREDGGEPGEDDVGENDVDADKDVDAGSKDLGDHGGDPSLENEEDEEKPKDKKENKKKNDLSYEEALKVVAKEKARRLKNANRNAIDEEDAPSISLPQDQVARGKSRYGSGN